MTKIWIEGIKNKPTRIEMTELKDNTSQICGGDFRLGVVVIEKCK